MSQIGMNQTISRRFGGEEFVVLLRIGDYNDISHRPLEGAVDYEPASRYWQNMYINIAEFVKYYFQIIYRVAFKAEILSSGIRWAEPCCVGIMFQLWAVPEFITQVQVFCQVHTFYMHPILPFVACFITTIFRIFPDHIRCNHICNRYLWLISI